MGLVFLSSIDHVKMPDWRETAQSGNPARLLLSGTKRRAIVLSAAPGEGDQETRSPTWNADRKGCSPARCPCGRRRSIVEMLHLLCARVG